MGFRCVQGTFYFPGLWHSLNNNQWGTDSIMDHNDGTLNKGSCYTKEVDFQNGLNLILYPRVEGEHGWELGWSWDSTSHVVSFQMFSPQRNFRSDWPDSQPHPLSGDPTLTWLLWESPGSTPGMPGVATPYSSAQWQPSAWGERSFPFPYVKRAQLDLESELSSLSLSLQIHLHFIAFWWKRRQTHDFFFLTFH